LQTFRESAGHIWHQLGPASARVHIASGWFFVEGF